MANPWEMNWSGEPEKKEKPATGKNPWDMDWSGEAKQEPVAEPAAEQPREMGMLWPVSWNAKDGSDYSFDSNAGLLGAAKRAFMAPGDAMAGKFDPVSEEGIARAMEFAGTFGGGATNFGRAAAPALKEAEEVVLTNPRGGLGNSIRNFVVGEADSPELVRQRIDDLQAVGVENPTVGMVSGSNRAAWKEQAMSGTNKRIQAAQKASEDAVPTSITNLADRMASATNPAARPTSKAELSQALIDQAETVRQAQVTQANQLYGRVGELTGNSRAVGDNSRGVLARLKEQQANLSNSAKLTEGPQLREAIKHAEAVVKDLDAGATFTTIKEARTALGALTAEQSINPSLKGHLQTLRSALSEDMAATARATGDEAFSAWKTADDFYKTHKDVDTGFGRRSDPSQLLKKNADNAYDFLMGKSKEGAERIRNLKGQLVQEGGQEVWDRVKGTTLMRASTDAQGNVSGTTFLKNFRTFSNEAKDEIWGPVGSAERDQMETIARAAETLKGYSSKANHSNTQNHKAVNGDIIPGRDSLLWAAVGGVKALAAATAVKGANVASRAYQARLLTNPATREWLADLPKVSIKKNGISNHVNRLIQIEQQTGDPATRAAIAEYLRAAGYEQRNRTQR